MLGDRAGWSWWWLYKSRNSLMYSKSIKLKDVFESCLSMFRIWAAPLATYSSRGSKGAWSKKFHELSSVLQNASIFLSKLYDFFKLIIKSWLIFVLINEQNNACVQKFYKLKNYQTYINKHQNNCILMTVFLKFKLIKISFKPKASRLHRFSNHLSTQFDAFRHPS